MSAKKADMSAHEPGWAEVILGAALSVVLGVVLGVIVLAVKPLPQVKALPKEPVAGAVYYIEGSRETAKAKQAPAKRKMFAGGGSVSVTEDEVNSFLAAPPPPLPPPGAKKPADKSKAPEKPKAPEKAAEKGKAAAPAASGEMLAIGDANFRFHDGKVQIAVPATVSVLGFDQRVTVLADGSFVKKGDTFKFEPDTLYLGSCPMQRLPFASAFVVNKFIAGQNVPEDIAAAWPKLASVEVDGNVLKLTMP